MLPQILRERVPGTGSNLDNLSQPAEISHFWAETPSRGRAEGHFREPRGGHTCSHSWPSFSNLRQVLR